MPPEVALGEGGLVAQQRIDRLLRVRAHLCGQLLVRTHEAMLALDPIERDLLPSVIVLRADEIPAHRHAVHDEVHVIVPGVGVAHQHVLVVLESHLLHVRLGHAPPLFVGQVLTGCGRERHMLYGLLHVRTEHRGVLGHFRGKRVRIVPVRHEIGADEPRLAEVLLHGVADGTAEALALDDLADHGSAERIAAKVARSSSRAPSMELTAVRTAGCSSAASALLAACAI
jgi:hypothetical protein